MPFKRFLSYYIVGWMLLLMPLNSYAQMYGMDEGAAQLKVKTIGRLIAPNKLIMVVEVDFKKDWKLDVSDGYGSLVDTDLDTLSMSIRFEENTSIRLIERLKAERKPSQKGFFYKKITFAQTIVIDTSQLPIKIDANLKWSCSDLKEKKFDRGMQCCLLKVERKRRDIETINIGWSCSKREIVYLEDVLK